MQREALGMRLPVVLATGVARLGARNTVWRLFGLRCTFRFSGVAHRSRRLRSGVRPGARPTVAQAPRRAAGSRLPRARGRACRNRHAVADTCRLIETYYDAFNRGDRETMLACLADDVVHDLNQGAREHGREAFRAFLARMDRSYTERLSDIVIMATPDGMRAGAEYIVHGTYKATDEGLPVATGQTYVLPGGAFFDIRDGRIARVTNYYNLQDWLRQVGVAA